MDAEFLKQLKENAHTYIKCRDLFDKYMTIEKAGVKEKSALADIWSLYLFHSNKTYKNTFISRLIECLDKFDGKDRNDLDEAMNVIFYNEEAICMIKPLLYNDDSLHVNKYAQIPPMPKYPTNMQKSWCDQAGFI